VTGQARRAGSARDEVLARVRAALGSPDGGPGPQIPRRYRVRPGPSPSDLVELLTQRLRDYGCAVHLVPPTGLMAAISAAIASRGARRVVVPPGLDLPGLHPPGRDPSGAQPPGRDPSGPHLPGPVLARLAGAEIIVDDGLSPADLDQVDGVITGAALAVAETGTIVLDHSPGQGRRALTLIPDYHLCLLRAGQVVAGVPEAVARLDPARPQTWISGPSATSDIEFRRVEGVHGPRSLEVIVVQA
jgi:L-lactate dehydrogenase complex protein LldG